MSLSCCPASPGSQLSRPEGSGSPSKDQLTESIRRGSQAPQSSRSRACSGHPAEEASERGLSLGAEAEALSETLRKGGQASEVLPARAKDFCGLGVSDGAPHLYPQAFEARGWGLRDADAPSNQDSLNTC